MKTHFTKIDLAARWGISRQLVNYRAKHHKDFPKPDYYVANNRYPVYSLEAVAAYETARNIEPVEVEE